MFQSPQWGSNSKDNQFLKIFLTQSFSPRNGEAILKVKDEANGYSFKEFQSPQWGSNSKVYLHHSFEAMKEFQSPQWGSNSKDKNYLL